MTHEETLVECREGVEVFVSSLTELLDGRRGALGTFHKLPQPTAARVIVAALGVLLTLADEGHGDRIAEIAQTIALATQVAVVKAGA